MKSSFLLLVILGALTTTHVFGQTKKTKKTAPRKARTTIAKKIPVKLPETKIEQEKSSFDKFYERLSISYFSIFTSSTIGNFNAANGAISPEWGDTGRRCRKNCDTYAMNLWNQVNFAYNFGAKMKFEFLPRFTVMMANPRDMTKSVGEDRAMFNLEDFLIGFSGVVASSDDKKFNWWMRTALRLPTSRFSRNYRHPDFGSITYQPDWINSFSYDFTKSLQVGFTLVNRLWVFEDRYNSSRHRIISVPYFTYAFDDLTKLQVYFEHIIENNKKWESINGQGPDFENVWQNLMVGISRDLTPKLNVMPFLSTFVNDVPYSSRSYWVGAWISYKIK